MLQLWSSRKAAFQYPIGEAPRTAVLVPWFGQKGFRKGRCFDGWTEEAARYAPAAIVGTRSQLLALAAGPPTLTHALIVVARPTDMLLTADDRDRLWRAFRVPVFEQLIGSHGERLAAECEAHDGLHIEVPAHDWTGYAVDHGLCACGLRTPRVSSPVPGERIRAAAMFAR